MTVSNDSRAWILVCMPLAIAALGCAASGCASLAVSTAPEKTPAASTPRARAANDAFWEALHDGKYERIDDVLESLTAAYLENPRDATTAAHIGFGHVWKVAESARLERPTPTVTDDIVLSRKYFSEATRLAPNDARFRGFFASLELAEASIHGDEKLKRRGYYDLLDARDAWPEFNLFTAGYTLSRLPATDSKFAEAVEYQWETLDRCVGERVDRSQPTYAQYMPLETREGHKRACWNSWIAPHNFEGFFLNMGDMLVKQNRPATAKRIYELAKLSRTYGEWPYRELLESRIAQADDNVAVFQRPRAAGEKTRAMMIETAFACTGCHQYGAGESQARR